MIEAELVAIEALAAERREAVRQRPVDLFALAGMEEAAG